jgi:hypothetical protein
MARIEKSLNVTYHHHDNGDIDIALNDDWNGEYRFPQMPDVLQTIVHASFSKNINPVDIAKLKAAARRGHEMRFAVLDDVLSSRAERLAVANNQIANPRANEDEATAAIQRRYEQWMEAEEDHEQEHSQ